jgi:hypothetical protein
MSIVIFILACVLLLVMWVASVSVVPWVGHLLVKILTFGRIDLGWRQSDIESEVSYWIGFCAVMAAAGVVSMMVHK